MAPEKRKNIRREYVREVSFESMLAERNTASGRGYSIDISRGGISLLTPHKAVEGEVLMLSIPLNGLDMTLPTFAEVIWVTEFQENYRAGLRFLA